MDIEKIISFEHLSGDQRELAETVGLEVYKILIENFGGCQLYIPKWETVFKEVRNKEIRKNFNGFNYRELAKKYNLSEKTVHKIVCEK
ncbi:MAG: transcriptional regulator [Ruminococcus sp.]|nr:transcriptional regulator [Ruminococcus sp.]